MNPANSMHAQTVNDPTAPAVADLFRAVSLVLDVHTAPRPLARDPMPELLAAAIRLGWRPIGREGARHRSEYPASMQEVGDVLSLWDEDGFLAEPSTPSPFALLGCLTAYGRGTAKPDSKPGLDEAMEILDQRGATLPSDLEMTFLDAIKKMEAVTGSPAVASVSLPQMAERKLREAGYSPLSEDEQGADWGVVFGIRTYTRRLPR